MTEPIAPRYRVGSHYGIHVYEIARGASMEEDRPVATASTPDDAQRIVDALNHLHRAAEELSDDWHDEVES